MKDKIRAAFLPLLFISIGLTILGYWLDNDPPISLSNTIYECIMMTIILFFIVSGIYLGTTFIFNKVRQLFS